MSCVLFWLAMAVFKPFPRFILALAVYGLLKLCDYFAWFVGFINLKMNASCVFVVERDDVDGAITCS